MEVVVTALADFGRFTGWSRGDAALTRVAQLDKLRSRMVPFAGFNAPNQTRQPFTLRHMLAVTHASAETVGLAMIASIIVVARVVVSGLPRRVECGTGV